MYTCTICKTEFKNKKAFCTHLTKSTHFTSELEKEEFLVFFLYGKETVLEAVLNYKNELACCNDFAKRGLLLTKYFSLLGIKRSSKEERQTARYKNVYESSIMKKYGVKNVSQSTQIQAKKIKTYTKKYRSYENYCLEKSKQLSSGSQKFRSDPINKLEIQRKAENTCLNLYGHKNFGAGKEAKRKRQETYSNLIATWDLEERRSRTQDARNAANKSGPTSKIELRVKHALIGLGYDFISNISLFGYNYDMILHDKNILIEVQGDMWHANPEKYKDTDLIMGKLPVKYIWDKDARKKKKAEEQGFFVVYIWENEIRIANDSQLELLIKNRILQHECR